MVRYSFLFIFNSSSLKISVRHYPDRPAPPPPSLNQLSPSSTDDMNATLLKSNEASTEDPIKRDLFGNFKGFSLKPLPMTKPSIVGASNVAYVHPVAKADTSNEQCMPSRAAPQPPTNSPKKSQAKSCPASVPKSSPSSFRYQNINPPPKKTPETPIEVKLFATKSDAKERPKISNPVLENSTISVKELVATANANEAMKNPSKSLPKNNDSVAQGAPSIHKTTATNKTAIKKLDISAPVKSISFGRSQSMRSPSSEKAPIKRNALASGSMRHPRPKNPPPPRPNNGAPVSNKAASLRNIYANTTEDGRSSPIGNSTDNIYCVIEDVKETPASSELLSEIVNEIESRNVNSIYSTTSKNQQKNGVCKTINDHTTYENIDQNSKAQFLSNDSKNAHESNNIYMNTANFAEQQSTNDTSKMPPKSNVASIAKKLSTKTAPGNSKPVIAEKPSLSSTTASKIETSQNDSAKKWNTTQMTNSNAPKVIASGKAATINPTSTVRAMHKRFEKRNA